MFSKAKECPQCKTLNVVIDNLRDEKKYLQKIIDRLLIERGLPAIKEKNLKIADTIKHEESDFVPVGREIYGEQ